MRKGFFLSTQESRAPTLQVQLLGGFVVTRDGKVLTDTARRSRRLWNLMKVLLVHHGQRVSVSSLVDALWGEEECVYPERALQNLVYRLRRMLAPEGEDGPEYILQVQDGYCWNSQAPCDIDTKRFEQSFARAQGDGVNPAEAEACLQEAVAAYRGELLPECGYDEWVIAPRNRYKAMYLQAVQQLIYLLKQRQDLAGIIALCTEAAQREPYEEFIHAAKMEAYLDMGNTVRAQAEYEEVAQMLYRELGVRPSSVLDGVYQRLRGSGAQMDVDAIEQSITGSDVAGGAYLCGVDAFTSICRVEVRRLPRSNTSVYLLIFSLLSPDFGQLDAPTRQLAMDKLIESVQRSLRRSDVLTRWSDNQVAVLLHSLTYEDAQMVVERIKGRFQQVYKGPKLVLRSSLRAPDAARPKEYEAFGN